MVKSQINVVRPSVNESWTTARILSWTFFCNSFLFMVFGLHSAYVQSHSESFSGEPSLSLGTTGWIVVLVILLVFSISASIITVNLVDSNDVSMVHQTIFSVLLRTVCLMCIVSVHTADTSVFKIETFYTFVSVFGIGVEPLSAYIAFLFYSSKKHIRFNSE